MVKTVQPDRKLIAETSSVPKASRTRENLRFTGRLNGVGEHELEERIDQLLERVGMTAAADQKTATYSKGMKQRLGIADVLMKDPQVIILDEPTNGIDPRSPSHCM